jgi:thiamine-phosphate pyrophosphorylase
MTNEARVTRPARARLRGLYAITPECADTRVLVARVEQALAGGAALVQYRAKNAAPALALAQARALAGACRAAGVPLIVNDSVELALASGAGGVHLGRDDARVAEARTAMPRGIIGVSCYDDPALARAAAADGADYVAIGSVFASATKPLAQPAALESIAAAKRAGTLPVAAIGGITVDNAPLVVVAGADMLAVISALFDAPDVEAASRAFARLFESTLASHPDARTQPRPV